MRIPRLRKEIDEEEQERRQLIDDILNLKYSMKKTEFLFDRTEDTDLIDALIYEHKALQSRYTYLIKKAKEMRIEIEQLEQMELNTRFF